MKNTEKKQNNSNGIGKEEKVLCPERQTQARCKSFGTGNNKNK